VPFVDVDFLYFVLAILAAFVLFRFLLAQIGGLHPFFASLAKHLPSSLSLLVSGLLFVFLLMLFMSFPIYFSYVYPNCTMLDAMRSESSSNVLAVAFGSLLGAWLLARIQERPWEYQGFGTRIYIAEVPHEELQLGTTWLVALMTPMIPVRTYSIVSAEHGPLGDTDYEIKQTDTIRWDLVSKIYASKWWAYALFLLGACIIVFTLIASCS